MAKTLADGIEPTEPFEMRQIRQQPPDRAPLVISRRAQLSPEDVVTFLEQLNATRYAVRSRVERGARRDLGSFGRGGGEQ